jgi:hypothetical protein
MRNHGHYVPDGLEHGIVGRIRFPRAWHLCPTFNQWLVHHRSRSSAVAACSTLRSRADELLWSALAHPATCRHTSAINDIESMQTFMKCDHAAGRGRRHLVLTHILTDG